MKRTATESTESLLFDNTADTRSLSVLVAEDNPVNQKVVRAMLERLGHDVAVVDDGQAALDFISIKTFDVVLMDVQMPRMDGLEATRRLREIYPKGTLRIIAVTANAMPEDQRRCLDAGMDDYIAKPVTLERLNEALQFHGTSTVTDPGAQASGSPAIDFQVLSDLTLAISEPRTGEILDTYLVNGAAIVEEMLIQSAADDLEGVAALAHRFKGSSSVVGANELAQRCDEVGEAIRDGETRIDLDPLRSEFERVRAALVEYRAGM